MKYFLIFLLLFNISCKSSKEKNDKIETVKNYYNALNTSDFEKVYKTFSDSIRIMENGDNSIFSKEQYKNWLQWDSIFNPKYKIIKIEEIGNDVKVEISKECNRILFLNEEPMVTKELVRFQKEKIKNIEILNYIIYNDEKWNSNKTNLVNWIKDNHPELNGFIFDQTLNGGLNYLEAMRLYNSRE